MSDIVSEKVDAKDLAEIRPDDRGDKCSVAVNNDASVENELARDSSDTSSLPRHKEHPILICFRILARGHNTRYAVD